MKTLTLVGVALCVALSLSACTARVTRTGLVLTVAARFYCVGVTEAGKQALRDALTGGLQLVACPAGTVQTSAPPPAAADVAAVQLGAAPASAAVE